MEPPFPEKLPKGRGVGRLGVRPQGDGEVIGDQAQLFTARAEAQTRNVQATRILMEPMDDIDDDSSSYVS